VIWLGPNSIRLASGHASAIRQELIFQISKQDRARFMPQSSHARLFAGLVVPVRGSSTRADG
jgi:hypothetical protein